MPHPNWMELPQSQTWLARNHSVLTKSQTTMTRKYLALSSIAKHNYRIPNGIAQSQTTMIGFQMELPQSQTTMTRFQMESYKCGTRFNTIILNCQNVLTQNQHSIWNQRNRLKHFNNSKWNCKNGLTQNLYSIWNWQFGNHKDSFQPEIC